MFIFFALEYDQFCKYDNLTVLDGNFDTLGTFCGLDKPEPIVTTTSTAILLFKTDHMVRRDGFSIGFTAIGPPEDSTTSVGTTTVIAQSKITHNSLRPISPIIRTHVHFFICIYFYSCVKIDVFHSNVIGVYFWWCDWHITFVSWYEFCAQWFKCLLMKCNH